MAANVKYLNSDGATQITVIDFGTLTAGAVAQLKKFGIQSISDRQLNSIQDAISAITGNDGGSMLTFALDTATLSAPFGFTAVLGAAGAGGVWGATGVYGWKIAATNSIGETIGSVEVTVNVDVVTKKVTLTWTQTPNATGYKIFRTATAGTYGATTLRATIVSGATVTFVDDGSTTTTGTPALVNTSAGWIVTPTLGAAASGGVWTSTGLKYWILVALDAAGNSIAQSLEASINVDVATKKVTLAWPTIPAAASYKLYRSTTTGVYSSPALVVSLAAGTITFDDLGASLTPGALIPNPSYGIPPTVFSTGPLSIGNEQINQQWFLWLKAAPPASTPEVGNPRLANITAQET